MEKKKCLLFLLGVFLFLTACGGSAEEVQTEQGTSIAESAELIETESKEIEPWRKAYIEVMKSVPDCLGDLYGWREERYKIGEKADWLYISLHDFDDDDIPEFMISDGISLSVFSYMNGVTERVADLYTPESWGGGINGVYFKGNGILLVIAGSDGCGYTVFGYTDGEYKLGYYDDYAPGDATVNGEKADLAAISEIYDLKTYKEGLEGGRMCRVLMIQEGEERRMMLNEKLGHVVDETFPFERIWW